MGRDWKYLTYVLGGLSIFVILRLLSPAQFDWTVTFAHDDKRPHGGFAFHQLLTGMLHDRQQLKHSYATLYELKDSLETGDNLLIIAGNFNCDDADTRVLLNHIDGGGTAVIAANNFWGLLSDTLNLRSYDNFFNTGDIATAEDSSFLKFSNPHLDTASRFWFTMGSSNNYFDRFDTLRTTVVAENAFEQPVAIRVAWGKGNLILCSTPMAFTNIHLLNRDNHEFISGLLSFLPESRIYRTEYYHLGRMEAQSPLRFVLSNEPLRWAYYLTIALILAFMIFEARRKQRIIPIVKAPANTSLEFVTTIGNLYYQKGDHKNVAEKKIAFLLEQIRSRYLLKTNEFNDDFFAALAQKSGNAKTDILALFRSISFIQSNTMISAGQLMDLNDKIERFNHPDL